jgi:hypothetical protein
VNDICAAGCSNEKLDCSTKACQLLGLCPKNNTATSANVAAMMPLIEQTQRLLSLEQ